MGKAKNYQVTGNDGQGVDGFANGCRISYLQIRPKNAFF
jgi:hypothetical protein